MKKALFVFYLTATLIMAYTDSDMDGVEDEYDKCAQTPLSDLVDYDGCSLQNNKSNIFYDVIFGSGYSQMNYSSLQNADTINSYIQTDIYLDRWYFQGVASYYRSDTQTGSKKGWDDTLLNIYYKLLSNESLSFNIGAGIILPTYKSGYENEKTDYKAAINFEYSMNGKDYFFCGSSYAWIRDRDFRMIRYQNTKSLNIGITRIYNQNFSYSISYGRSDSIYKNIQAIQTVEAEFLLNIDSNWFLGAYYGYGLSSSASDNSIGAYIGYYLN